jgi:hypothetical protein
MKKEVTVRFNNVWKEDDSFILIPTIVFVLTRGRFEMYLGFFAWVLELEMRNAKRD